MTADDKWFDRLYAADESAIDKVDLDRAVDLVFDHVDDLLLAGEFSRCNDLLRKVDVERLSVCTLGAFLAATVTAHRMLKDRTDLIARVEARLRCTEPDRVERLMAGLKGTEEVK